jgi:hypothetical protein
MRAGHRLWEEAGVGEDQRHPHRLLVDVERLLAQAAVGHRQLAVVGEAHHDGVLAERGRGAIRRVEAVDDRRQLAIDLRRQVGVEVRVLAALLGAVESADGHVDRGLHRSVGGRLQVRGEVLVDACRQPHRAVEVGGLVVGLPVAREAEHVVGVDQGDHQAEGTLGGGRRAPPEELERLLEVGRVVARAAAAEVLGPRVAAGVGRGPALEPVRRQLRRGQLPVPRRPLAQVPLAAPLHVVATVAQHRAEVRQVGGEDPLGRRERPVVGERVDHAVLGRHQPGQEAGPARAAHRRVAGRLVEAHPVPQEPRPRGHVLLDEARRPMHRRALLVGDDEDDIRLVLHSSFAFAPSNSASVRAPFSRSSLSL